MSFYNKRENLDFWFTNGKFIPLWMHQRPVKFIAFPSIFIKQYCIIKSIFLSHAWNFYFVLFWNVHSKHIRILFLPINLSCLRTKSKKKKKITKWRWSKYRVHRLFQLTEGMRGKTCYLSWITVLYLRDMVNGFRLTEAIPGVRVWGWAASRGETRSRASFAW